MESPDVTIIELHMMDKRKLVPCVFMSGFTVRLCTYPLVLVRTRLQVQKQKAIYNGTFDAMKKIQKADGIKGFYKGFMVQMVTIFTSMGYILTYESLRQYINDNTSIKNKYAVGFLSGGFASMATQPILVPVDNVMQRQQMQGVGIEKGKKSVSLKAKEVVRQIYSERGVRGFYRGMIPSVLSYSFSSACYWCSYTGYGDMLAYILPNWVPHMMLLPCASACASVTVTILTNPIDLVRTRVQVQKKMIFPVIRELWREEGLVGLFMKGATARMSVSLIFSVSAIATYEFIKRLSLLPEYKDEVRW